jgi:hypothetical protein
MIYRRLSNIPGLAISTVISTVLFIILVAGLALTFTIIVGDYVWGKILGAVGAATRIPSELAEGTIPGWNVGSVTAGIAAISLAASIVHSALAGDGIVLGAFMPVFCATLLASSLYTAFMFALRLSDAPVWDLREERNRWYFISTLLVVRLIPSALLFYIILSITIRAEQEAVAVRWGAWFLCHFLYHAAVILPFMLLMLLRVRRSELECLRASCVGAAGIWHISLFKRFWKDIVIIFVFVFVMIWNGDAANSAMSSVFQSVNIEIVNKLHGRSMDMSRVLELLIPTFSLAFLAVGLLASGRAPVAQDEMKCDEITVFAGAR